MTRTLTRSLALSLGLLAALLAFNHTAQWYPPLLFEEGGQHHRAAQW